jgi:hypothetical protein
VRALKTENNSTVRFRNYINAGNNTAIFIYLFFIAINMLYLVSRDNNTLFFVSLLGNKNKYRK